MEQVKRIASALVILPPLVWFLCYASPVLFLILVLVLIGLSLYEYVHILQQARLSVCTSVTFLAALALASTAYLGGWRWLPIGLFLSMVALTLSVMVLPSRESHVFPTLVYSSFGVLFIGWNLSHLSSCAFCRQGSGMSCFCVRSFGQVIRQPCMLEKAWDERKWLQLSVLARRGR